MAQLVLMALGANAHGPYETAFSIGPTFSGGEIDKPYSDDMYGSEAIYEYGLSVSGELEYLESSLQLETGRYNRNQAHGIGLDLNAKCGLFQDRIKLYGGFGYAYNGYAFDYWVGPRSIKGEFTHDFSPYLTAKTELFKTLRLGIEGLVESKLHWKARLGLALLHF